MAERRAASDGLGARDRSLKLRHAVVEREEVVVRLRIALSPPLVAEERHALGEPGVPGYDQTSLAGGHVLVLLQAERSDGADGADQLAVGSREEGLGAVLDHRKPVMIGDRDDPLDVARVPEQVGRDHGARPRRDARLDALRGQVQRDGVDVGEGRDRALVEDRRDRTHVGVRG